MFTGKTYQDWLIAEDRLDFMKKAVRDFKGSDEFRYALTALRYFRGDNVKIAGKTIIKAQKFTTKDEETGKTVVNAVRRDVVGNRIGSNHFFTFVMQENQHLLSNGVTVKDEGALEKLGVGFNRTLEQMGEYALVQGVCWGFFNHDRLEFIPMAQDANSGLVALLDEMTGLPRAAIQFWQLSANRPVYYRLFEEDGVTIYREETGVMTVVSPKEPYNLAVRVDGIGEEVVGGENWAFLPVIPFYGNSEKKSELTPNIKAKIDAYDVIISDFSDNLERANEVYWVLNNFGGDTETILDTLETIERLKVAVSRSDGMGTSSAEPKTLEVPYQARREALEILDKQLYADYMALNMNEVTGGSLTNVAIEAASANLNMKSERFGWCAFDFVQKVLRLVGVDTDQITFKRKSIANVKETIECIYLFRNDIDQQTALELNPMVEPESIAQIMMDTEAERVSGLPTVGMLQDAIDAGGGNA